MAVKAFQWYQYDQAKGLPGMKTDSTNDDVFSFGAEQAMDPGVAVVRGTNPETQIKPASTAGDGAKVIGVSVHTHKAYDGNGAYYEEGYAVPVAMKGDVYVEVGADVTAGGNAGIVIGDNVVWAMSDTSITDSIAGSNKYTVVTNAAASDTVAFGGATLTGGAITNGFVVGADSSATAHNLATAFGADTVVSGTYDFSADGNVLQIVEKAPGGGNTPGSITCTGTCSIVGGTATTSGTSTLSAETVPGATYLESGSAGDIVALRIMK